MIIDDRMLIEIDAAVLTFGFWTWRRPRRDWQPPGTRATTWPYAYFALSDCGETGNWSPGIVVACVPRRMD